MSIENQQKSMPRSVRHRQILDVAEANPSAAVAEIAAQVPSATPELVEQVFEEHGDPASDGDSASEGEEPMSAPTESANGESGTETQTTPDTASETTVSDEEATDERATDERATDAQATDAQATDAQATDAQATDEQHEADEAGSEVEPEPEQYPSLETLSEKHRKLLDIVAARPAATQADLAAEFDVTRATVSRWASEIPGFEWRERESFIAAVFDDDHAIDTPQSTPDTDAVDANQPTTTAADDENAAAAVTEIKAALGDLTERVTALEATDKSADSDPVFEDPELVHKIVHACLESERISEAEELRILKRLLE